MHLACQLSPSEGQKLSHEPQVDDLVALFGQAFFDRENTRLIPGGEEPIYLPADTRCAYHRIIFTRDYVSSALHEVAHWCVAGAARRLQVDYGYWYTPDGRSQEQQARFEQVEVLPQALEWIFSTAARVSFRVSADNLALGLPASEAFKSAIAQQARALCQSGLSRRPAVFLAHLAQFYGVTDPLSVHHYTRESLE